MQFSGNLEAPDVVAAGEEPFSLLCRPVCYEEPVYQEESVSCDFGSVIRSVGAYLVA